MQGTIEVLSHYPIKGLCGQMLSRVAFKWSGKFGQHAKMYPTRTNGYENDETTELFRQV